MDLIIKAKNSYEQLMKRDKINLCILESEKRNTHIHIQKSKFTCLYFPTPDSIIQLHRKKKTKQVHHGWTVSNKIIWQDKNNQWLIMKGLKGTEL